MHMYFCPWSLDNRHAGPPFPGVLPAGTSWHPSIAIHMDPVPQGCTSPMLIPWPRPFRPWRSHTGLVSLFFLRLWGSREVGSLGQRVNLPPVLVRVPGSCPERLPSRAGLPAVWLLPEAQPRWAGGVCLVLSRAGACVVESHLCFCL